jgi:hypothetical protein
MSPPWNGPNKRADCVPIKMKPAPKATASQRVAKIERPDAKHEHVADDDVERSPANVDERGELGSPISPIHALVTYTLASSVAMLSVIPGGIGTFEAVALTVLHVFGVSFATAAAAVILLRIATCLLPMLPGYVIFRHELITR